VLARRILAVGAAVRTAFVAGNAPRCSLNRRIGSDRRLAIVHGDLGEVRRAARGCGATVNDVLLAAVAGGLGALLAGRGEHLDALRAVVPIALPRRRGEGRHGNMLGQMIVTLPVCTVDPVERLRLIAAQTAARKWTAAPRRAQVLRGVRLQRAAMSMVTRQRAWNVYIANVRGPRSAVHLNGARVEEVFPVVALMGNQTLGVGALSYADRFSIVAVGDEGTCPDLDAFAAAVETELHALART
jgi:diacylglycerol O-acyltransferase / wax synthase